MRPFQPEHYFRAAQERIRQAHLLYRHGEAFAFSMYAAGLAAECMLRAFKGRRSKEFDERHDVQRLFEAGLLRVRRQDFSRKAVSEERVQEYKKELMAAVNDIHLLWSNDYRFASEARLTLHLRRILHFQKIVRGDILKAAAYQLINACQKLIDRGSFLWERFSTK